MCEQETITLDPFNIDHLLLVWDESYQLIPLEFENRPYFEDTGEDGELFEINDVRAFMKDLPTLSQSISILDEVTGSPINKIHFTALCDLAMLSFGDVLRDYPDRRTFFRSEIQDRMLYNMFTHIVGKGVEKDIIEEFLDQKSQELRYKINQMHLKNSLR